MSLISALEDLQQSTLKAISGTLRKLEYLSRLREKEGDYAHWGLERVYGDLAAKRALTQAHRSVLAKVLATPIRHLVEDAEQSSNTAEEPPAIYVERLSSASPNLLPPGPGAGSARHLNSVLHALSSLIKHRKRDANPLT
jgi:hypothetical protein